MKDFLIIFSVFIFPVILFNFKVLKGKFLTLVLLILSAAILIAGQSEGYTWHTYGIRSDNLASSLWPYLIFTVLGILFIIFSAKILKKDRIKKWWTYSHFTFLFIPISITQEFLYRGYLMPKLESLFHVAWIIILLNPLLYTFAHIFFDEKRIVLPLTFLAGICFAVLYYFYPNLIWAAISHCILNFFVVLYSFFTIKNPQTGDLPLSP